MRKEVEELKNTERRWIKSRDETLVELTNDEHNNGELRML